MHVRSFAPLVAATSRVLVLGSMPGRVSLRAGEYYAHPRNLFWPLMGELLGVDPRAPYAERVGQLLERGVALWDVLHACTRHSSLDSHIVSGSMVPNDFGALFARHPALRTVCFNGAKAADVFAKAVLPGLGALAGELALHRLPSTSPANASIPYLRKRAAWQIVCAR